MNKSRQKKQKILRFLFGSLSATALMFTFQACYGPPQKEYPDDLKVEEVGCYTEQDTLSEESAVQEEGVYTLEDDGEE